MPHHHPPVSRNPESPKKSTIWFLGAVLVLTVVAVYQPVWHAGFIWDDDKYVTNNPLLSAPDGLWRIWFSLASPSQYFPLTYSVFRLEWQLWGLDPTGYHWVNILLHATNALFVWRLLARLAVPGAWLAAVIFALHPVQVESVAWITELKSILSLFFILQTLLAWIRFVENPPARAWPAYAQALLFFILALCSKTTACTLPVALLLVLWLKGLPITRSRLVQVIPFVALGLGMGLLAMWWERYHQGTQGKTFDIGWLDRILIASRAVWFYAGKLAWPENLTFSYPRWHINPADPLAYGGLLAVAALAMVIYFLRHRTGRGPGVVALFYLATLAPTLGFVMLYTFRYSFVADHYQYVACLGPFSLVAAGMTLSLNPNARWRKRFPISIVSDRQLELLSMALAVALLVGLGALSWRQCGMYLDRETLWRTTLARNPASLMAHDNLGILLFQQGRLDEAISQSRQAVELDPVSAASRNNLANALLQKGEQAEAVVQYRKAVELEPGNARVHSNLGNALLHQGQVDDAIVQYQAAIQLQPDNPIFLNNLAWLRATYPADRYRNAALAVELAQKACELTGDQQPQLLGTLAAAYAEAGRFEDAVTTAQKAADLATTLNLEEVARKNLELLQLYRHQQPYRETSLPLADFSK